MIDKVSNQGKISIFDVLEAQSKAPTRSNEDMKPKTDWAGEANQRQPEMKAAWRKQREDQKKAERQHVFDIEAQKERKLSHNSTEADTNDPTRTGRSIRSARSGNIKEEGGPTGQIKGRNSIFNPDAIVEAINAKNTQDIINQAEGKRQTRKAEAEKKYRESQIPQVSEDDYAFRNGSSIIPAQGASGMRDPNNGKVPTSKMSIFDNSDFERLEATAGEKMEKKSGKKKDDSWREPSKTRSTREVSNEMFDRMAAQAEKGNEQILKNGNPRKNANSLFDNLMNILDKKDK